MPFYKEWINRLRYAGRRVRFEDELDDEIRFHLETRAAEIEKSGLSHDHAMRQARREFGSVTRSREESRSAWQFIWLQDLAADLRYAFRGFRRSPGFTLTAVLSLALGIGANSAIFTTLDTVMWRDLPVADPASLVTVSVIRGSDGQPYAPPAEFVRQVRESGIFSEVITRPNADGLSFTYDDRAERIIGEAVSPNFFTALGVQPVLGQPFTSGVRQGKWAAEAVISYNFWKHRFGGNPAIIGMTIRLNTYPFTVVGVSPPGFFGLVRGTDSEVRLPVLPPGREIPEIGLITGSPTWGILTLGRLRPGTTIAQAEAAAAPQFQEFLRVTANPRYHNASNFKLVANPAGRGANPELVHETLRRLYDPLYVVAGLVAIVLLIASVNVANMLLARASAREREFAIRVSIGAGRFRLIRQMLAESMLLSLAGGAIGIGVAYWSAGVLFRFIPQGHVSVVLNLQPDGRAVLFTFGLSILTGALFGLAPAAQLARRDLAGTIKADSAGSLGGLRGIGFRKMLIAAQVAFSLVLLIAAGMFIGVLTNLRPVTYRANPKAMLLFMLKPQAEIYTVERRRLLAAELVRRISLIPGVEAVGLAASGPLASPGGSVSVQIPGGTPARVDTDSVTPGFLDTIGVARLNGRDFSASDVRPGSPLVAIVNQALARQIFPHENPIGRKLLRPGPGGAQQAFEIVGLVADAAYFDIRKPDKPVVWFPLDVPHMPTLHVRSGLSTAGSVLRAVRDEFDRIDKGFPVFNVKTLETRIDDSLASEQMVANISGVFGVLALTLAAVGLYGVLAYSVSRRTREIGIRLALGSGAGKILAMIAREAALLVGAGGIAGVVISAAAARILSRVLPPAASLAPSLLAECAATMLAITLLAACVPAIRACRIDPLTALRHE